MRRNYLLRRIGHALIVMLGVTLFTFLLTRVVGNPVDLILGRGTPASPQVVKHIQASLGLNEPLWRQYLNWLWQALHGNLGRSYSQPISVLSALGTAAPVTFELSALALALAIIVGIVVGMRAATHRGRFADAAATVGSSLGIAIPNFWLGIILIYVFALRLGWFPASGYIPITAAPGQNIRDMVLPVLTLAAFYSGSYTRYMRSLVLAGLSEDYARAAQAKGISRQALLLRHVLRNALVPFITVVGLDVAGLIGGAVVTEVVFSLPGVGSLLEQAILGGDVPIVEGTVLAITAGVVLLNLILDFAYGALNPQARLGGAR